ncbi:MAG: FAD-dependent oxidoreductase [Dehalococcoidales bacterium]|nr:MAG: FAD-dependent oxidoreductase [Dehalococcoidales bacterium]
MNTKMSETSIIEPARETKICYEADVVVVGGGPGGIGAAVCAARAGADTVLIERYGHLGGMATGGLVNIIPNLGDIYGEQHIAGIVQEIIDRMDARGAASYPSKPDWGTTERTVVDRYLNARMGNFFVRDNNKLDKEVVLYSALVDPEVLKDELNDMMKEAGVKLYLHSWGTQPVMEGNRVGGVIFESKSGRQAILGKVVIDSTGDGDLLMPSGAEVITEMKRPSRIANLAFCFWITNVDNAREDEFKAAQPEKYDELMKELTDKRGFARHFRGLLKDQESVIWFHPHIPAEDQTDIGEMTRIDIDTRKRALITYEFLKNYVPGYEKSYIMQTAPQLGTTGGRRVVGDYVLKEEDMNRKNPFEDTIAVFAGNDRGELSHQYPKMYIPYRSLVPKNIDGLLVACRAFSSEDSVNTHFNLIPHCLCFGQAAGTAAARALDSGVSVRDVDIKALQKDLRDQGVILPV